MRIAISPEIKWNNNFIPLVFHRRHRTFFNRRSRIPTHNARIVFRTRCSPLFFHRVKKEKKREREKKKEKNVAAKWRLDIPLPPLLVTVQTTGTNGSKIFAHPSVKTFAKSLFPFDVSRSLDTCGWKRDIFFSSFFFFFVKLAFTDGISMLVVKEYRRWKWHFFTWNLSINKHRWIPFPFFF